MNVTVQGFDRVDAYSTRGGTDEADLYDTAGDDHLEAADNWAKLFGPDSDVQYLYQVLAFEQVRAHGKAGGKAWMYDHPDRLYDVVARNFETVEVLATLTDADSQNCPLRRMSTIRGCFRDDRRSGNVKYHAHRGFDRGLLLVGRLPPHALAVRSATRAASLPGLS